MFIHWDLAKRLMMGSRRDAATRMSALLALGLLCLTSLGATLVVAVNTGLQDVMLEAIAYTDSMPDGTLDIEFSSRASMEDAVQGQRIEKMKDDLRKMVKSSGGDLLSYDYMSTTLVPMKNLAAYQSLMFDEFENWAQDKPVSKNRAERFAARKIENERDKKFHENLVSFGAMSRTACLVQGKQPPDGEFWLVEGKAWGVSSPPRLNAFYALVVEGGRQMTLPVLQKLRLSRVIKRDELAPRGCWALISSNTMSNLFLVPHY